VAEVLQFSGSGIEQIETRIVRSDPDPSPTVLHEAADAIVRQARCVAFRMAEVGELASIGLEATESGAVHTDPKSSILVGEQGADMVVR